MAWTVLSVAALFLGLAAWSTCYAEVQQIPGGTALFLWRDDERWRLTYTHFKDPRLASAFIAERPPPTVRGLVSAA